MIIKTDQELAAYQAAGKKSTRILRQLFDACKEGVTSAEIDALADELCQKEGVKASFRGVGPKNNRYQWATCISVNDTVVQAAAKKAVVGNRVGDLSHTMQSIVEEAGFSVAKEFVGHGIGRGLHDEPQIPAWGRANAGRPLEEGMVLCVEAQVMASENDDLYIEDDGWTVKSEDGAKSAMFEYMVVVKRGKPVFLTPTMDWPLF
jgi:methionine aminopeptidase